MSRALLVDDNPVVLTALETLLDWHGWSSVRATDLVEALEALRPDAGHYDAVVLDLELPDGLGTDLAIILAVSQPSAHVVLHSAHEVEDLPAGIHAVVRKSQGIGAVVEHLLERAASTV